MAYKLVSDYLSNYSLIDGEPFSSFDTLEEFKYQMKKYYDGIWDYELVSRRDGSGSRSEHLIKCSLKIENGSNHKFFIFLCQIEGGGRSNLPDEQRIQFRTGNQWNPSLHSLGVANSFSQSTDLDNNECYFLGIYKRSENDHDVVFVGVYPEWIHERGLESTATSNPSFQINIGKIQESFHYGSAMYIKTDGQRAICFKPHKIIWYMKNRDILHLNDLDKVDQLIKEEQAPYKRVAVERSQIIFYGAPGTGKSHTINEQTEGESVIRTTFHPDSDYSTFVGAYKPTMKKITMRDLSGHPVVEDGVTLTEDKIIYEFVEQAFLQAYVQAWKYYAENASQAKKQFLIIEEINRGNCAQIFGDLFQLLDRNQWGFSDYPINADKDMKKQLEKAFKGLSIKDTAIINSYYKGKNIVNQVLNGEILLLPNNLYIWATMNTSDQSLFPIDSAFKRRWEWQYMPIGKGYNEDGSEIKWSIEGETKKFSWWSFLEKTNAQIAEATQSEDKKLGFFFCKATDNVISAKKFVGKVIFYLWNDVFKNNGFEGPIFKDTDGSELSFGKFYKSDTKGNAIVQKDKVELFLNNLGVEEFKDENNTPEQEEDEDGNVTSSPSTGRDYTKFSVNGNGRYAKNNLAAECVKKYIELNPTKSAEEILSDWLSLGNIVPHFVESKEQYEARTDNSKRSHEIPCAGTVIYVAHNGYGSNGKVLVLKEAVNQKNWGITIDQA